LGQVGGGVVGPGPAEFAAAMGSSFVVVDLVLGWDHPQMSFAEDQHLVGDLVRAETSSRVMRSGGIR
jgi:hypothetical protein